MKIGYPNLRGSVYSEIKSMKKEIFMKRVFYLIFCVLILSSSLFAAGGRESQSDTPYDRRITILKAGAESAWDEYYQASFERFSELYPGTEFEYSSVGWPEANTKINLMYAGGAAPDIIAAAVGYLAVRAGQGQFLPLDDYFDSWSDKNQYQDAAYRKGVYKGKFYGLGYHWDPRIFVYRKDLFRAAGLDPEKPPVTWEDLSRYAELLTVKQGDIVMQSGLEIPSSQTQVFSYIFLNQNGTILADESSEKPLFNNAAGIETFEYLAKLFQLGVSAPHAGNKPAEKPFLRGTAAMAFTTPSQLNQFLDSYPDLADELGFIYNLKKREEATFGGMYQYFITNQSENPDAAWEYLAFMMSSDETRIRIDAVNSPPTRNDVMDYFMGKSRFNEAIMQSAMISKPWPNVVWSALYRRHLDEVGMKTFLGVESPASALKIHQEELEKELAQ